MTPAMSTLKEMATSLNLSVMAVSKALRDAPDISVGTKARVQAEARRRNYIPNRAAQNLRLREPGLIGIVVPQINHTYYSHLVWGVERQAEAIGLQVLLGSSLDRAENEMREVQKLISRQVEALLLVPRRPLAASARHARVSAHQRHSHGAARCLSRRSGKLSQRPVGWSVTTNAAAHSPRSISSNWGIAKFFSSPARTALLERRPFSGYQKALAAGGRAL